MLNVYTWHEAHFHVPIRIPDHQPEETVKAHGDQGIGTGAAFH
jgi:hypothetical protein